MVKQLETMNKIIDNLDNIRLELKQKALVNGDTKCARMEHELKTVIADLISLDVILQATKEILDSGNSIVPDGAIHEELKNK